MGSVCVAAVQFSPQMGDVAGNSARMEKLVREAAGAGAKLIVTPELATTGYVSPDLRYNWSLPGRPLHQMFDARDPLSVAETVPGPTTARFCSLAKELGVYLTIPVLEIDSANPGPGGEPRLFNTVCLADPQGTLLLHYRKLNLWPYTEPAWATPGDRGLAVAETPFGSIGIAVCYDIHTILPRYQKERLWALLFPSAWVEEEHPAHFFWHELPGKARRNGFHILGANWSAPRAQRWRGYGFSTLIDRHGQVAATARSLYGEEVVVGEIEC